MNQSKMTFIPAIIALLFFLVGCESKVETTGNQEEGIQVVTTFYPVYDFAKQVVGDNGTVHLLVSAGQDSHGYEPTPKDMAAIADADVFIYSTEHMETWVPAVLDTLTDSDVKVIEAAENISFYENEEDHDHEHDDHGLDHHHIVDPHVWLDPLFASEMTEAIAAGIIEVDVENEATYEANKVAFQNELAELDEEFRSAFEGAENRTFVVQHAAFGYLARRYELKEVAVSSFTSDQEISPAQIAKIGQFMQENDILVIYYQDSASSRIAETLANETDSELALLSAIEGVTEEQQAEGIDYLSLMRQNIEALKKSIQ